MSPDQEKRLLDQMDRMSGQLASIDKTLAVNTAELVVHIKRTEQLEARVEPIERHVQRVGAMALLFGYFAGFVSIVAGVLKIISFFQH